MSALARLPVRFLAKMSVDEASGCWVWTAARTSKGYGQFRIGPRPVRAHRYAYTLLVGPIPDGLQLDHLCRNRLCVNPGHLEPVTNWENTLRGENFIGAYGRRRAA